MYSPMHDDDEDDPAEVAVAPSAPSAVPPPARPGPPPAPASSAFRRARQLFQQLEAKGGGGSGAAGGGAGTAGGGTAGTAVAAAVAAQPAAPSVKAQFSSLARPTATLVGASSKSLTGWVQFGEELASTAAAAQPRIPAHGDSSADESEASSAGEDRPLFKAPSKTSVGEGSRSRASSKASSKSASSWTSTRTSTSVASVSARSSSSTSLASSTAATGAGNGRPSSASSAAYSEPSAVERFHDAFEIRSQSGSGIALGGSGIAANATHASASRKVSTARYENCSEVALCHLTVTLLFFSASSHGSARQQQQPPTVEICAASFETSRDTPLAQMAASAEDPFASPPADPFQDQEVANTDPFALPHDAPHLLDPFHERPALRSMRGSFESSSSGPRHDPVDSTSTSFFDESISQGTEISVTARVSTSPQELKPALPPRPSVQSLSSQEALALPPMMPPRADSQFSSSSIYSTTLSTAGSDAKPRLPLRPPLLYRDMTSGASFATEHSSVPSPATHQRSRLTDNSAIYPDSTDSNRRPPRSTLYTADISIRSNIKSFAAAKNFVCVGHHAVKVMDATSGVTIPLAQQKQKQEARVTAMAFVPSLDVNNDGEFLWAGFNDGDLWMVRCSTGDVLERRVSGR